MTDSGDVSGHVISVEGEQPDAKPPTGCDEHATFVKGVDQRFDVVGRLRRVLTSSVGRRDQQPIDTNVTCLDLLKSKTMVLYTFIMCSLWYVGLFSVYRHGYRGWGVTYSVTSERLVRKKTKKMRMKRVAV